MRINCRDMELINLLTPCSHGASIRCVLDYTLFLRMLFFRLRLNIERNNFIITKLYLSFFLSLGFILKIFLKFRKFQPQYSYKIYSYRKKKCTVYTAVFSAFPPRPH